jgi:hypothetical protein
MGLPEGSSNSIWAPPGSLTMSLRNRSPTPRRRSIHFSGDVVHHELNAVPAARPGLAATRHGPSGRAGRPAEQEPKVATGDVGERWSGARQEGPRWAG